MLMMVEAVRVWTQCRAGAADGGGGGTGAFLQFCCEPKTVL